MCRIAFKDEYEKVIYYEHNVGDVEIRERSTGKTGVANTYRAGVAVFYGADDGSDDKVVSREVFNRDFEVIE